MEEMLGICKLINQGVWSRSAPIGKCHEITFIVNWCYTKFDSLIDMFSLTFRMSQLYRYTGLLGQPPIRYDILLRESLAMNLISHIGRRIC